jgi:hypothetical protein
MAQLLPSTAGLAFETGSGAEHRRDSVEGKDFARPRRIVRARALFGARLPAPLDELTDALVV